MSAGSCTVASSAVCSTVAEESASKSGAKFSFYHSYLKDITASMSF